MGVRAQQKLAVLGRLRMADWIEMPEREFAREIERVEKDPLFRRLHYGADGLPSAIRRRRWPGGRLSSSFYGVDESRIGAGQRVDVEGSLDARRDVLPLIRRMGRASFERYFLHGDEPATLPEIAKRTGLSESEVARVNDLLLEIGAQAEFAGAPRVAPTQPGAACLARLALEGDKIVFEFASPYWARGLYQVRYDDIESWKSSGNLTGPERRRLRHLLKRLETLNLRQSTIFRILESFSAIQADFLRSRDPADLRPVSLRLLARRLDLAPSTVSRALARRTLRLPWGPEVPMISFVPGQRRVLKELLSGWLRENPDKTDADFARRFKVERGIDISRRTVNAVRHALTRESGVLSES
ncbi:MAG: hypothetical protein HKL90_07615 [Elusimicrobia bacterium]|nr:hypothetical protein [Elusimicrobiota bacterium]